MMDTPDVIPSGPRPDTPALIHESYEFIQGSEEDPTLDWVNVPSIQQFVEHKEEENHSEPRVDSAVKEGLVGNTTTPPSECSELSGGSEYWKYRKGPQPT